MTFGHLAAHIVPTTTISVPTWATFRSRRRKNSKETEGKDKLVAAIRASFEFCHRALAKADDSKMNDNITWFDGKPRTRAWAFMGLASSWADHYGEAAMYLRFSGLLPPTAKQQEKKEDKKQEKK